MFDAEVIGNVFLIEATEQNRASVRSAPPGRPPGGEPAGQVLAGVPEFLPRRPGPEAAFPVTALVFDNGVLDRLTVETGLLTVTADLGRAWKCKKPGLSWS